MCSLGHAALANAGNVQSWDAKGARFLSKESRVQNDVNGRITAHESKAESIEKGQKRMKGNVNADCLWVAVDFFSPVRH